MEVTQPGVEQLFPNFHIRTVHLDIIKVLLFTNWCISELSLKDIEIYIKTAPKCFCVTVTPSSGKTLICAQINDDAVTVTRKHVGAFFLTFCWPCISVYLSQYLTNLMNKICFTISFISCLYMFRAHVLIIRRSKLHYTASGIITPIGGRLVHRLREDCRAVARRPPIGVMIPEAV